MKQALKNGFVFNYVEHNTNAQNALVFIHGNSHSHKIFRKQEALKLQKDFRLIFLDLPGHGDSERLPEYTLPIVSELVSEFIQLRKIENYAVIGHSFGGHVAIHALPFINPIGLFIFGTSPVKKPFDLTCYLPNPLTIAMMKKNPSHEEIDTLMTEFGYAGIDKDLALEDYLKADGHFRDTIFNSVPKNDYRDEVELLKNYKGKLKILISNQETTANNQYIERHLRGKNGTEFTYLYSKHSPQIEDPEAFNLILQHFVQSVFGTK